MNIPAGTAKSRPVGRLSVLSLHEFINGLAQIVDGVRIPGGYRVHHAVAHMILEDHLARIIQGGANRRQLDQHLGAIVTLFHHPPHLLQMADGPGQPVEDRLLVLVDMTVVMMVDSMGMEIPMIVMFIMVVAVTHGASPFLEPFYGIIPYFPRCCKPHRGISFRK